ncbi:ABC transporter ATP-binding protein [Desulfocurvus sp. DL9XJH121]
MRHATDAAAPPLVSLDGISKAFGPVQANLDIHLDIHAGRVLALLGENGAGKSTLMSMLSGVFPPDSGRILLSGVETRFASPRDAIAAGIGMVYQHFKLVNSMTVAQNMLLGQEQGFFVSPRDQERRTAELAENYGLAIDPSARVRDLSMGERQRVEILKLLARDSRVLIFDEPTAVLTPGETEQLFAAFRRMTDMGKAVVFISHKLGEVLEVADTVAILLKGEDLGTVDRKDLGTKEELATRMVGHEVRLAIDKAPANPGKAVLEIRNLSGGGLAGLDLTLRRGEIVAVVGVAGNGQKALVETVTGMRRPEAGSVALLDKDWKAFYAAPSWKNSIAHIPEDRLGVATCPHLDLTDNVLLTTRRGFASGPFLQKERALGVTRGILRRYHVAAPGPEALAANLSGGNLQKLVLGREFYRKPQIIVAEQPSQGLDVAATEEVWHRLVNARLNAGVLLVTGDLNEALQLADRIAVMFRGRFMDVFEASDQEKVAGIGLLMAGLVPGAEAGEPRR